MEIYGLDKVEYIIMWDMIVTINFWPAILILCQMSSVESKKKETIMKLTFLHTIVMI